VAMMVLFLEYVEEISAQNVESAASKGVPARAGGDAGGRQLHCGVF